MKSVLKTLRSWILTILGVVAYLSISGYVQKQDEVSNQKDLAALSSPFRTE